jgi:putative sugar O-methyltransferase
MPKITIDLDLEKIDRLKEYLNWIQAKSNSKDSQLSDYWVHHSDQIEIKFNKSSVLLSGESGFYFPRKLNLINQLKKFARLLPPRLSHCIYMLYRNILPALNDTLQTYQSAYENLWRRIPDMTPGSSSQKIELSDLKNKVLNFRTIKGMKEKWPASDTEILSEETIKHYFHLQLMEGMVENLSKSTVCEIGSGTGNLASLLYYHFNTKLFLVDIPKTLLFSFSYLSQLFPDIKILLPNEAESGNSDLSKYDIVMVTPDQASIIPDGTVDLTVNIGSMQEMTMESINSYFDMMDRITKPKGYFFTSNRVEKIMSGEPIRFSEFPWRSHTRTIFFEINPLIRLVQLDQLFVRLEQYP